MNKVILLGRLTKDANTKCDNNTIYAKFTLAVEDHSYIEKNGKCHVDYIQCCAFGKIAEVICNSSLKKGQMVCITGKWRTGSYLKRNGEIVYTQQLFIQELFFCGKKEDNASRQTSSDKPIKIYWENSRQEDFNIQEELAKISRQHFNRQAKAN